MHVRCLNNSDYNTCHECNGTLSNKYMYNISAKQANDSLSPVFNGQSITLCKNCLFKLYLELDNIFPYSTLMNGHDQEIIHHEHSKFGIPKDVYKYMKDGFRIKAIKALRDKSPRILVQERDHMGNISLQERSSLTLLDAKHQIDKWSELLFGKNYNEHYRTKYYESKHRS